MHISHSSHSEFITVRKLKYHIRHWGNDDAPVLFMLHGWMDVSASFQFMIENFRQDWHIIAPDWRGFGLTERLHADTCWYPDYLADLDAILEHYSPRQPVRLLGHSMGGNVAMVYAGVRPEKIAKLINLEGVGLQSSSAQEAPLRYSQWLGELRHPPMLRTYGSLEDVAARLQKNNPRLTDERATFLAAHWARQQETGSWELLADPVHKVSNPVLYRIDEITSCWDAITAPVLWVEAEDSIMWKWKGTRSEIRKEVDRRISHVRNVSIVRMPDAGHMVHHDQPKALAEIVEHFLAEN